jgi:tetratricopeptide (TPR) repeat protein
LFSIATNHQNALELEEAIKYFDILYNQTYGRGIEYPDAIGALYNSALLKVGLGQYKEAAEGLENYAKKFPDQPDAEQAFFMAGEQWEKVARWRALEFYTRYLKKYAGEDPNHTMMAHYRRIELYREAGNKQKEIDREWKELIKSYEQMLADGKDSPKMRQYAAEHYLRDIPDRLEEFKSVKYTRNDEKNAGLIQSQLTALKELQEYCAKPGTEF